MFKATRDFIIARQQHAKYKLTIENVKSIGGGVKNDCFRNACKYKDRNPKSKIVSGWMIRKFNPRTNSTAIIQHYWNVDSHGFHVDTTPLQGEVPYEYVVDMDIVIYSQLNYSQVESCVCSSLHLENGNFYTVELTENDIDLRPVKKLTTSNLFFSHKQGLLN
jgi:hypothetical protein